MPELWMPLCGPKPPLQLPRAHMIGATGAGMKGLAEILLDDGWKLSGSDSQADPQVVARFRERGMHINSKHAASAISAEQNLVVFSAAIPADNVERQAAKQLGIPQLSYVQAVARIVNSKLGIAVAGTHGKSSTTAWIGSLLYDFGQSPLYLCGAERLFDHRNGKYGTGELAVVEACEYRRHFLSLRPQMIVLLGIEHDHFDCYADFDSMLSAYREFLALLPEQGHLIYNLDCNVTANLAAGSHSRKTSYSRASREANYYCEQQAGSLQFFQNGIPWLQLQSPFLPRYQLQNLLAAISVIAALGIDLAGPEISQAIQSAPQLKRRFEILQHSPEQTVIDDYAHHPTEIRATLAAARAQFPGSRLLCCFQPHQLSRTQNLRAEFVEALLLADIVYLLPVYAARETPTVEFQIESERLVEIIQNRGRLARFIPSLDQVWRTLETDVRKQDVILTLGAGDLTRIHYERTR